MESIKRHEHYLAAHLNLREGDRCLDLGCGVGGPYRNIARFSGARVDGITINQYQVRVGQRYNEKLGLLDLCKSTEGDFMHLPWDDETFDAAYQIEATCHAPDRTACFSELNRCLKMGGVFGGYSWVMTPKFDPENEEHMRIKISIEAGNGLPTLTTFDDVRDALGASGFELLEDVDVNLGEDESNRITWYAPLEGSYSPWNLQGFRMTWLGRQCTHIMVSTLELLGIAPKGTTKVSKILNATADDLVNGGRLGIFTPSHFYIARKVREV